MNYPELSVQMKNIKLCWSFFKINKGSKRLNVGFLTGENMENMNIKRNIENKQMAAVNTVFATLLVSRSRCCCRHILITVPSL